MNTKNIDLKIKKKHASQATIKRMEARKDKIFSEIEAAYPHLKHSSQLRCKHFVWFVDNVLNNYAEATRQDYIRTLRLVLEALGKHDWIKVLKIARDESSGGRKSVFTTRKSKRLFL